MVNSLATIAIDVALGYMTNVIAVKMLTRPYTKTLGIQGVIPSRRKEFAVGVANMISRNLLASLNISDLVSNEELLPILKKNLIKSIISYIDSTSAHKPTPQLSDVISRIVDEIFGDITISIGEGIEISPEIIESIIIRKLTDMPMCDIDRLITTTARKELKFIEWIGALIGLLVGIIQVFVS